MYKTGPMRCTVINLAAGTALGILTVVLIGTGGGIGIYSATNGGMGGAMSGNHMAQCGAMNAECSQDHATCVQNMPDGTHHEWESMSMTLEECQAMHDQTYGDMMPGGMMAGSCL